MPGRTVPLLLIAVFLTGCGAAIPAAPTKHESPSPPTSFDAANAATITGQVRWSGDLPQVPVFIAPLNPIQGNQPLREWYNPNLPIVDARGRGVKDAVVFLRGVDTAKARPWDHKPVRVEFRDDDLFVVQGDYVGRRGFVRRGDAVEVVSKQSAYEALQVRGDAYFTLTLPDRDQPRSRHLDRAGLVELSSGVARFWMRGHLFVADHPYFARTDAEGRFALPLVPPGQYQLVCWHPNWHEDVREHDADTVFVCRLTFRRAAEVVQDITVATKDKLDVPITLQLDDFPR